MVKLNCVHEILIHSECPHGGKDRYESFFYCSKTLTVESIRDAIDRMTSSPIYQEDITLALAEMLGCDVKTVGMHKGFKTTCIASHGMIHYHGTPFGGPVIDAGRFLRKRHAFVSFAAPSQIELVAEVCQSFALDNGAFSTWRNGRQYDFDGFYSWAMEWYDHPGFDWIVIPDVIDGSELENDLLIDKWINKLSGKTSRSVPVWHMHESVERMNRLCDQFDRVAIGSSGEFSSVGSRKWWSRISLALEKICVNGRPKSKLHGLRMLNHKIFEKLPLASADSTNVARNVGMEGSWKNRNSPSSKFLRAEIIAERIESYNSSPEWENGDFYKIENCSLFSDNLFEVEL